VEAKHRGPGAVIIPRLTAARRPADPYTMMADRARRTAGGGPPHRLWHSELQLWPWAWSPSSPRS